MWDEFGSQIAKRGCSDKDPAEDSEKRDQEGVWFDDRLQINIQKQTSWDINRLAIKIHRKKVISREIHGY